MVRDWTQRAGPVHDRAYDPLREEGAFVAVRSGSSRSMAGVTRLGITKFVDVRVSAGVSLDRC